MDEYLATCSNTCVAVCLTVYFLFIYSYVYISIYLCTCLSIGPVLYDANKAFGLSLEREKV
jgi:hypothetical protein